MIKAVKKQFAETKSVTQKLENTRIQGKTAKFPSLDRKSKNNGYPSQNLGKAFQYLSEMSYQNYQKTV